ncbi:hypothetical protein EV363DRAFT_1330359 [Boletus edulis]|nr:hypothetical protein EV363DRAFT_1330359 [Boletus edulis]
MNPPRRVHLRLVLNLRQLTRGRWGFLLCLFHLHGTLRPRPRRPRRHIPRPVWCHFACLEGERSYFLARLHQRLRHPRLPRPRPDKLRHLRRPLSHKCRFLPPRRRFPLVPPCERQSVQEWIQRPLCFVFKGTSVCTGGWRWVRNVGASPVANRVRSVVKRTGGREK